MLIRGDARHLPLRDASVDCVVTSPPYFGLRDYGTASWDGGDPTCDHRRPDADIGHIAHSTLGGGKLTNAAQIVGFKDLCGKCGAVRKDAQIGLEPSPDAYVASLVTVFREVRRVLKDDGTVWLNLGDSYATGGGRVGECPGGGKQGESWRLRGLMTPPNRMPLPGLKPKDLIGIPWRVAFALQADGWYLCADIIWHKPNPMPESVTDRPTKAHEYLFLLAKQERYHYDAEAIAERAVIDVTRARVTGRGLGKEADRNLSGPQRSNSGGGFPVEGFTRNTRTVWTVSTMPYSGAHFATMPEKLVEPCILAGCPMGGRVLDPFVGSGTVVAVAERLGRVGVGVDLRYQDLAAERTAQRGLRFDEAMVNV